MKKSKSLLKSPNQIKKSMTYKINLRNSVKLINPKLNKSNKNVKLTYL